jgi:hypothetical protein
MEIKKVLPVMAEILLKLAILLSASKTTIATIQKMAWFSVLMKVKGRLARFT